MDPKYVAVKGKRGVDIRCCAYASGPIMAAHDARNRAEPKDHLWITRIISIWIANKFHERGLDTEHLRCLHLGCV